MEEKIEYWLAVNDYPLIRKSTFEECDKLRDELLLQDWYVEGTELSIYCITVKKCSPNE